jgi:TetR/AcrR family transcriptional regulator, repressor for uid operon
MRKVDPVRHDERRREILDAAMRCFARDGLRGASIADICTEAGMSPGHLYHYFESKEAIVRAMTQDGLDRASARFAEIMKSSNAVEALLMEIERPKLARARPNPVVLLDMLAEAGRNPAIGIIMREHSRGLLALIRDFLRNEQERGHVDPSLDAQLTAAILLGVLDGAKTLTLRDPKLDVTQVAQLLRVLIGRFLEPRRDCSKSRRLDSKISRGDNRRAGRSERGAGSSPDRSTTK